MSDGTKRTGFVALRWVIVTCIVAILAATAWATSGRWWPLTLAVSGDGESAGEHAGDEHEHAGHDHSHAGHSEATSIELSDKALQNIGFRPVTIKLGAFERMATIPAIVIEQPGQTQINVASPLTGVVSKIAIIA